MIIGAGIYVLVGVATSRAGAAVWLAFVLAALLSALTALSYAELASLFPKAGAEYEYTRQALPEWTAFLIGVVMITGLVVAASAVSLGFARYLQAFVALDPRLLAALLIVALTVFGATGIRYSARLTVLLSAVQVGGLLLVIAVGLPHLGHQQLLAARGTGGVLSAAALVFFAFIGFDDMNTLAEETRNPTRTVPLALLLSLGIATLLYVGVAVAAVSVLGASALAASPRPLADVLSATLGSGWADGIVVIAIISTVNTTLISLTAASRLLYGMASTGAVPRRFGQVNRLTRTPLLAMLACASVALPVVLVGDIVLIASITDFAVYTVFLAVNATVILLRVRRPDVPRPFRTPLSIGRVPLLPVLGFAAVVVMLLQLERDALVVGGVLCAAFATAGLVSSARRHTSARV
jgi:basic amino acid/polyamine antiporter, APA family